MTSFDPSAQFFFASHLERTKMLQARSKPHFARLLSVLMLLPKTYISRTSDSDDNYHRYKKVFVSFGGTFLYRVNG